ncbi:hypothetical protein LQR31_04470 [Chromobacterium vaccinii]|uniref:Holin n=2 Tax=Chromobacterium TaxID=535 RepID=A0A1D9LC77_9NEIS|nr:hypothetical protein [Chromobacterium vaccinii]AOZ48878.1 hypothetical protein BKX93_01940 [Chromobacterium vaccinii]MCD4483729.1 hypothetical protein [Chromobacterium vaccinii]
MAWQLLRSYLLSRAQEASTWRGVLLLATSAGLGLSPQLQETIVTAGLGLAGLVGVLLPDGKGGRDGQ